ncbi:MAG: AAA family ATPase [Candidatus Latescibacteria bacterium]|nr:AAA family ATPase [Candidatus Latescibacterota bacterium]
MIPSFEIQNYRLFKHLMIDKLARVNLITGKNNVGKTAVFKPSDYLQTKYSRIRFDTC